MVSEGVVVHERPYRYYTPYELRKLVSMSDAEWRSVKKRLQSVWYELREGIRVSLYPLEDARKELRKVRAEKKKKSEVRSKKTEVRKKKSERRGQKTGRRKT